MRLVGSIGGPSVATRIRFLRPDISRPLPLPAFQRVLSGDGIFFPLLTTPLGSALRVVDREGTSRYSPRYYRVKITYSGCNRFLETLAALFKDGRYRADS